MARRSLRPQLNQIRAWVRQGRTDAWIAHQLEITATELQDFRRQNDLTGDDAGASGDDLRDEIEAEIEAAQEIVDEDDDEGEEEDEDGEGNDGNLDEDDDREAEASDGDGESGDGEEPRRGRRRRRGGRRGRRGGRGRKDGPLEATFDHGEKDGFGLWLDPAVQDNSAYSEHWAGQRAVTVTIEAERIVITRPGDGEADADQD
ncbi:MAG: hypothetical protein QOG09_391 [Solirubrobacterales bacterium]|jgi:hypothetical protein|nr:hypothetical protein [Solirubrobacterales bacterium]